MGETLVSAVLVVLAGSSCAAPDDLDSDADSDVDTDTDADADSDTEVTCFPAGTRSLEELCATSCGSASDCPETESCWLVNGCPGGSKGICGSGAEACRAEGCAGPCCFDIGSDPSKVTSCEPAADCCG